MEPTITERHRAGAVRKDPRNSSDTDPETFSSVQEDRSSSDMDDKDSSMSRVRTSDVAHSSSEKSTAVEYIFAGKSTQFPETSFVKEFATIEYGEDISSRSSEETDKRSDQIEDAHPDEDIVSLLKTDCLDRRISNSTDHCICEEQFRPEEILDVAAIHNPGTDHPAGESWPEWETAQELEDILKIVKTWVKEGSRGFVQANRAPPDRDSLWRKFSLLQIEEVVLQTRWEDRKTDDILWAIIIPWRADPVNREEKT